MDPSPPKAVTIGLGPTPSGVAADVPEQQQQVDKALMMARQADADLNDLDRAEAEATARLAADELEDSVYELQQMRIARGGGPSDAHLSVGENKLAHQVEMMVSPSALNHDDDMIIEDAMRNLKKLRAENATDEKIEEGVAALEAALAMMSGQTGAATQSAVDASAAAAQLRRAGGLSLTTPPGQKKVAPPPRTAYALSSINIPVSPLTTSARIPSSDTDSRMSTILRPSAPPPPIQEEEGFLAASAITVSGSNIPGPRKIEGSLFFAERVVPSHKIERPKGAPPVTDEDIAQGVATFAKIMAKQTLEKERDAKRRRAAEVRERNDGIAQRKKELAREKARKEEEARKLRERTKEIATAQAGRNKLRMLPPPPPPNDPIKFLELSNDVTSIVPRGKLYISISRVTGLGVGSALGGYSNTEAGKTVTGDRNNSPRANGDLSKTGRTATMGASGRTATMGASGRTATMGATSFFSSIMPTTAKAQRKMRIVENEDGEKMQVAIGDVYCRFELVLGLTRVEARTPTYRNVILTDFEMLGAEVEFRLSTGVPLPKYPPGASSLVKGQLPPLLFYTVWKVGRLEDSIIGEGSLPAGQLFTESPMGDPFLISLPLFPEGEGSKAQEATYRGGTITAWMSAKFHFRPTKSGILTVTVSEGLDLQSYAMGSLMPYPRIECGVGSSKILVGPHIGGGLPVPELSVRGSVCVEGGSHPMFNHEELVIWIDHEHGASDTPIVVALCVDSVLEGTKVVGSISIPVHDWTKISSATDDLLNLRAPSILLHDGTSSVGDYVGRVMLQRRFYPSGLLTVKILAGMQLESADITGTNDAYVHVSLDGRARSYAVSTRIIMHTGPNPTFGETFVFDVVDHADLRLGVWDFDRTTADDLVGEVMVDLAGVYEFGVRDAVVPIKRPNLWGGLSDTGYLHVEIDFVGSLSLAYPLLQAQRPSFTGEARVARQVLTTKEKIQISKDAVKEDEADSLILDTGEKDWEDDDIEIAFNALDLNKDLYINRTELRHALFAFGENVTSLEIDEMLDMADFDGDGKIAFYEFYQLLKERDPAQPMWKPKSEEFYKNVNWFAVGGIRGLDQDLDNDLNHGNARAALLPATAELARVAKLRAIQIVRRLEKKAACEHAIATLHIRYVELQAAFRRFQRIETARLMDPTHRRFEGREAGFVTAEELAKCLDVEADSVRPLFLSFRDEKSKDTNFISMRDLLLGLLNFAGSTRPQRIKFCFDLFETSGDARLDKLELCRVLKGAHLAAHDDFVIKKAEQIIQSIAGAGATELTLEQFVIASSRFPNILFPSYEDRDENGALRRVVIQSMQQKDMNMEMDLISKRRDFKNNKRTKGEAATMTFVVPGEVTGAAGSAGGKMVPHGD